MRRKDNYVIFKRATPKRVNLPNDRFFVAGYKRVPRDRLPPNVMIRRRYKQRPTPKNNHPHPLGDFIVIRRAFLLRTEKIIICN